MYNIVKYKFKYIYKNLPEVTEYHIFLNEDFLVFAAIEIKIKIK